MGAYGLVPAYHHTPHVAAGREADEAPAGAKAVIRPEAYAGVAGRGLALLPLVGQLRPNLRGAPHDTSPSEVTGQSAPHKPVATAGNDEAMLRTIVSVRGMGHVAGPP